MYYAFLAPDRALPNRANRYFYFVRVDRFMAEEYDRAFAYDWSKRWAKFITNREQQYAEHVFPLAVVGEKRFALPNWVQGYEKYWRDIAAAELEGDDSLHQKAVLHAQNAEAFGDYLQTLTEQYQISYIELDQQLGIDKVCDIFTQINSKGVQLDTFDLINALLRPKGVQLKQMWRDAAARLEFVDSNKMNVYILQVMARLRSSSGKATAHQSTSTSSFLDRRSRFVTRMERVAGRCWLLTRWHSRTVGTMRSMRLRALSRSYGILKNSGRSPRTTSPTFRLSRCFLPYKSTSGDCRPTGESKHSARSGIGTGPRYS